MIKCQPGPPGQECRNVSAMGGCPRWLQSQGQKHYRSINGFHSRRIQSGVYCA